MFFPLMAQISRRDALDRAPFAVRLQLWLLLCLGGLILSSVRVYARGETVSQVPITSWWPFVLAVLSWIFSLGMWWAQFTAIKDRLNLLEITVVRKDKLEDRLDTLSAQIQGLRALIERSERDWRDMHHGSKE